MEMRVRLPRLPLFAPVVKRTSSLASNETFQVRFLVGAIGKRGKSAPPTQVFGRPDTLVGPNGPVVQRPGRPCDMGETVVQFHPGLLNGRVSRRGTAPGWKPDE